MTSESDRTAAPDQPEAEPVVAKIKAGAQPNGVVYAFGAIWVADLGGGQVLKVDVRRNKVVARYPVPKADWITPSADALWVSTEANDVVRLDPATGAVLARIPVGANPLASAWVGGELWVPNIDDGTISVIDPATNSVRTTFAVGKRPARGRRGRRRRVGLDLDRRRALADPPLAVTESRPRAEPRWRPREALSLP